MLDPYSKCQEELERSFHSWDWRASIYLAKGNQSRSPNTNQDDKEDVSRNQQRNKFNHSEMLAKKVPTVSSL